MKKNSFLIICLMSLFLVNFNTYAKKNCCNKKIHKATAPVYCDTSAGFLVLKNGSFSKTYCRYSAIMNYQRVHGCCTWAGGILAVKEGNVICRNGTVSAICSIQNLEKEHEDRTDNTVDLLDNAW